MFCRQRSPGGRRGYVKAFLDGLLPEGEARRALAADYDLLASDAFGLIGALASAHSSSRPTPV